MNTKKFWIIASVLGIGAIIALTAGLSYAYFAATVNGSGTNNSIKSALLDIDFATSAYISQNNLFLINDADKATKAEKTVFTVKHASGSNIAAKYTVSLTNFSISTNFKSTDFKWELLKGGSVINSGNFSNAVSGTDYALTSSAINLPVGQTDSLTFRLWLSSQNKDQLSLTNGSISAKVKIDAVN